MCEFEDPENPESPPVDFAKKTGSMCGDKISRGCVESKPLFSPSNSVVESGLAIKYTVTLSELSLGFSRAGNVHIWLQILQ